MQANPASGESLGPLELRIQCGSGLVFGPVIYPEGEPYRVQGADEDLSICVGRVEIGLRVAALETAESGEYIVNAELHYQAIHPRMCLAPASVWVLVDVTES